MDGEGGAERITHSQVIQSTLVTVGYPDTLDKDLDLCSEVLTRAVTKMKQHERSVNFKDLTEQDRMKAIFVLNTMYALEKKFKGNQPQPTGHPTGGPSGPANASGAAGMPF
jgi:hypothetical protein